MCRHMHACTFLQLSKMLKNMAQKLKNEETPTMDELLKKLLGMEELDMLSEALRDQLRNFVKQSWKLIHIWAQKKTGS